MIAVDMDGTLLNSNGVILDSSIKVLKEMKRLGKIVVIITGRSINESINYLNSEFVDYLLANNGSIWYKVDEEKIIKRNDINQDQIISLFKNYSHLISHIWLATPFFKRFGSAEEAIKFLLDNEYFLVQGTVHFNNSDNLSEIISILKDSYSDLEIEMMQDSFSDKKWINILPSGITKGNNLLRLAKHLKVDINNTVAFGDGLNDISMIKVSGIGVAMGNALDELKKEADFITDSNDEDGIYNFLTRRFYDKY